MSRSRDSRSTPLVPLAAGLAALQLFTAPLPAFADTPAKKPAAISLQGDAIPGDLRAEASRLEKSGRWLGAVTAWRELARVSVPGTDDYQSATRRLHDLAGLSWMTSVKSKAAKPLTVTDNAVLFSYRVKYSDRMRDVVAAFDRAKGTRLWMREDAVVVSDMVFIQNWQHVARVDLATGGDLWSYPFQGQPAKDTFNTPNRKLLGVDADTAYLLGDTWPVAVDLATGTLKWGPNPQAMAGYKAIVTAKGVVAWPGRDRPGSVPDSEWRDAPLVLLDRASGRITWKRDLVPGEPWIVAADGQRLYVSDPNLISEKAWTAISLDSGQTLWRQPQAQARPSTITPAGPVLIEQSTADSSVTRFLAPDSGRELWQTDRMVRWFPQGTVLEEAPLGPVVARELSSGQVRWQLEQTDDLQVDSVTAVADGNLYMAAYGEGSLSGAEVPGAIATDLATGKTTWRTREGDTPYEETMQTLATAGDLLIMERQMRIAKPKLAGPTQGGMVSSLVALDTATGEVRWGFWDLTPERDAPPVRVGDMLWLVGEDRDGHTLYAFDLAQVQTLVKEGRRWWW